MKTVVAITWGLLTLWLVSSEAGVASDKTAARSVLVNMRELTTRIDAEAGKYYINTSLWASLDRGKKLQVMTAVADAHACLEGRARQLQIIDSLTGAPAAEASPTRGIRLIE
jgi:hypothetical protein